MIFGYIAAGLAFLFGLGGFGTRQFEIRAAAAIRGILGGNSARVGVHTRAVGLDALSGHFKSVTISASDFSAQGLPLYTEPDLPKTGKIDDLKIDLHDFDLRLLHVKTLQSSIPDCRFDLGLALRKQKITLSESGIGTGFVEIAQQDLEAFILKKYPQIKQVHVEVRDGRVHVWGFGEFLVIRTNFDVVAQLMAIDGAKLALDQAAITFDGRPADETARRALLQVLNPVVDLSRDLGLYDAISVRHIVLKSGIVYADGATKIPVDPHHP